MRKWKWKWHNDLGVERGYSDDTQQHNTGQMDPLNFCKHVTRKLGVGKVSCKRHHVEAEYDDDTCDSIKKYRFNEIAIMTSIHFFCCRGFPSMSIKDQRKNNQYVPPEYRCTVPQSSSLLKHGFCKHSRKERMMRRRRIRRREKGKGKERKEVSQISCPRLFSIPQN